jgi:hypothetical protein
MVGKAFCKGVSARIAKIGKWSNESVLWQLIGFGVVVFTATGVLCFCCDHICNVVPCLLFSVVFIVMALLLERGCKDVKMKHILCDPWIWLVEGLFLGFVLFALYVVYANFVYVWFEVLRSPYFVSVDKGSVLVMLFTVAYLVPVIITGIFAGLAIRYIRDLPAFVAVLLLSILLVSYTGVVILGQWLYPVKVEEMKSIYGTRCTLENAWSIANATKKNFIFTYKVNLPKPRQLMIPGIDRYLWVPRGLMAVADTGTCEDFAIELTTLLRDVLGCEARVVVFVDYDHALPEVKIDGVWYVLDISYTTPARPVRAENYWMYLNNTGYSKIIAEAKGLVDRETGKDVSAEHGFTPKR